MGVMRLAQVQDANERADSMSKDATQSTQELSDKLHAAQDELSKATEDAADKGIKIDSLQKHVEELEGRLQEEKTRGEGERSAAQASAARIESGVSGVSDAVLRGTYVSSGDVEADEAAGFTDATFEMPSGMAVDENGLPLYVETPEHHAGGEKKGIARIVSDMLAGDAEMQKNLPGHVMDVDAATSQASTSASTSASASASASASSLGSNFGVERFVSGVSRLGGAVSSVSSAGVSAGSASASVGPASARLSDTVDDGFQQRWSRVFFMLFAFNLLAAGTLLRVAAWEMRRLGWLGGAERAKAKGTSARRP